MTLDDRLVDIVGKTKQHASLRYYSRPLSGITHLVVHHSADEGTPWSWAEYHVGHHGWPGVAYHVAVMGDGTAYKCQPDSAISYHAGGKFNPVAFGFVLQGDLTKHEPTAKQLAKLLLVARRYVRAYSIPPGNIIGHRDAMPGSTVCPGAPWVVEFLRAALAS